MKWQPYCNHFTPIDRSKLFITPPNAPFVSEVPCFAEDFELYELLKGAKKTFSVPGDIPPKILSEMLPAFMKPINNIIQSAIQSEVYPTTLKIEWILPLPKVYPPSGYDELRPLSLTQTTSKMIKLFMLKGTPSVKGPFHYVKQYFSPDQFTMPGHSCAHALLSLIDFILKNTDKSSATLPKLLSTCRQTGARPSRS